MAKLNQIIAVEKGVKSRVYSGLTTLNKAVQKSELFNGFSKVYNPKDDEGEKLPAESKRVQMVANDVLRQTDRILTELFDVTARKDWTNCVARANVVVNGVKILSDVPVTYLLFLEKQLNDVKTLLTNIPVLDFSEDWEKDINSGLFKTPVTQSHRTKKVQRALVLYPATTEHPAQTQLVTEDVIGGFWNATKFSGALPAPEKEALLRKVEALLIAVKEAREEANNVDEVSTPEVGEAIFGYLFDNKVSSSD